MSGNRQQVREAIASYFGGTLQTSDLGIYYQGGPLASLGLGTAFPYLVKNPPETAYTAGEQPGTGWGAVMTVLLNETTISRIAMAGPSSGFRIRRYVATCGFSVLSWETHLETAEAACDDLIDAFLALIYADHTLGTTTNDAQQYPPNGRLITQAGEAPAGIVIGPAEWEVIDRGKARSGFAVTFAADTLVQA